jgi:hypothetical protein
MLNRRTMRCQGSSSVNTVRIAAKNRYPGDVGAPGHPMGTERVEAAMQVRRASC